MENGDSSIFVTFVEFIMVLILTWPGKFTIISPYFFYLLYLGTIALFLIQFFVNLKYNDLFAHGSLFVIGSTIFTYVQMMLLNFLVWDFDFFLYDFRLLRYGSLGMAVIFDFVYFAILYNALDLFLFKAKMKDEVDDFLDVIVTLVLSATVLLYIPTFAINSLIILKELTLN